MYFFYNYEPVHVHIISKLIQFILFLQKDDPLQKGYQRVDQAEDELLSKSPTETSLETVVLDTNADSLSGAVGENPSVLSRTLQNPSGLNNPLLEKNPFEEELTLKRSQQPKSVLKDSRVSFDDNYEDEAADKIEDNFAAQRAHFQKYKSHSSANKRLLLNVRCIKKIFYNNSFHTDFFKL